MKAVTKSCQTCGKPLKYRGGNHKYCDTCRDMVNKENKRLWEVDNRSYKANFCVNCGKPIYAYNGHGQKYCKACSVNVELERIRFDMMAYRKKWKDVLICL